MQQVDTHDLLVGLSDSAKKLKSTFNEIYEKYNRNFDDESDIIDLQHLAIVKDNGHLTEEVPMDLLQEIAFPLPHASSPIVYKCKKDTYVGRPFFLPRVHGHFLSLDTFEDTEVHMIYSCFMEEINWFDLEKEGTIGCLKHLDNYCQDCFDCCLRDLL